MNADHIFRIGSSHKVCEDYATSLSGMNRCFAGISDGCSLCLDHNNKPIRAHTDIGSRLLLQSAANAFTNSFDSVEFATEGLDHIVTAADRAARQIGLRTTSLSATLLLATLAEQKLRWLIVGDGVTAIRDREGNWTVSAYSFHSGIPYYLRYELYTLDKERFLKESFTGWQKESFTISADGSVLRPWKVELGTDNSGIIQYRAWDHVSTASMLLMFSDGLQSFTRRNPATGLPESVPLHEAIRPFLAFRNYRGEFVQRRASHALQELAEQGITHSDDFSMSAIYTE